jgi:hypothetical protein
LFTGFGMLCTAKPPCTATHATSAFKRRFSAYARVQGCRGGPSSPKPPEYRLQHLLAPLHWRRCHQGMALEWRHPLCRRSPECTCPHNTRGDHVVSVVSLQLPFGTHTLQSHVNRMEQKVRTGPVCEKERAKNQRTLGTSFAHSNLGIGQQGINRKPPAAQRQCTSQEGTESLPPSRQGTMSPAGR